MTILRNVVWLLWMFQLNLIFINTYLEKKLNAIKDIQIGDNYDLQSISNRDAVFCMIIQNLET